MKKEWTEAITNFKILYNCNTASTCTVWLHAAHTTDQLSSSSCWTGVIQKSLSLNEKYWRIFLKKFRRKDQQAEEDKIERVTGLGRRTREDVATWNQMTALRYQTGGRHQTSPASLRGEDRKCFIGMQWQNSFWAWNHTRLGCILVRLVS